MTWHLLGHIGYDAQPHSKGLAPSKDFHLLAEEAGAVRDMLCNLLARYYAPMIKESVEQVLIEPFKAGCPASPTALKPIGSRYKVLCKITLELVPKS